MLQFVDSDLYFVQDKNNFINPLLQVGSGSAEKSTGSGRPKINGSDRLRILIPVKIMEIWWLLFTWLLYQVKKPDSLFNDYPDIRHRHLTCRVQPDGRPSAFRLRPDELVPKEITVDRISDNQANSYSVTRCQDIQLPVIKLTATSYPATRYPFIRYKVIHYQDIQ